MRLMCEIRQSSSQSLRRNGSQDPGPWTLDLYCRQPPSYMRVARLVVGMENSSRQVKLGGGRCRSKTNFWIV